MKKKAQLALISIALCPSLSFAFFCPTNFNQIDYGYTADQIIQQCGAPSKQETKKVEPNVPQEWSYYIPQTVATNAMKPEQGTLKTQMSFDSTGKVINISVNGLGVGSTTICGNQLIQLGDNSDRVKAACGTPSIVTKQDASLAASSQQPKEITEFTYATNPPVKFIFENGKLTQKQ